MLKRPFKRIADNFQIRMQYQKEFKDEITAANLKVLSQVSLLSTVVIFLLMILAPVLISGWRMISITHVIYLLLSIVYYLFTVLYYRVANKSAAFIQVMCFSFVILSLLCAIFLDANTEVGTPGSFFQVLVIVFPILFSFPLIPTYICFILLADLYGILLYQSKLPDMAQQDIYNAAIGIVISVFASNIILNQRMEGAFKRNRYLVLSTMDEQTGVLSKSKCEESIRAYLKDRSEKEGFALFILDIDNFKSVADTVGHQGIDVILKEIGNLLLQTFRTSDILGRCGNDEFLILMQDVKSEITAEGKCKAILQGMHDIRLKNDQPLTGTIGAVVVENGSAFFHKTFEEADQQLMEAKSEGKDCYHLKKL